MKLMATERVKSELIQSVACSVLVIAAVPLSALQKCRLDPQLLPDPITAP